MLLIWACILLIPLEAYCGRPCVEKRVDYYGYDRGEIRNIKSWQECGTRCSNDARCSFWTYATNVRVCMFKTSDRGRRHAGNRISGVKGCPVKKGFSVNGNWGRWTASGSCDKWCGGGRQKSTRLCNNPPPQNGGRGCVGQSTKTSQCNRHACAVNGNWGSWTASGSCDKTCGGGRQKSTRLCNNPPPQNGGRRCLGQNTKTSQCNRNACPVNGNWGSWTASGSCDKTCGGGRQKSTRLCNNPTPQHGGRRCLGQNTKTSQCNRNACPGFSVNGNWGSWTASGSCDKTCGGGRHKSTRLCNNPPPQHGGKGCVGQNTKTSQCNSNACPDGTLINLFIKRKTLTKSNLVTTLLKLGKTYDLSFEVFPTKYQVGWSNVLHLSAEGDYSRYGDRTPGVWFHSGTGTKNRFHICSAINGDRNHCYNSKNYQVKKWIKLRIQQRIIGKEYVYTIDINGKEVYRITNKKPGEFKNVKVYASDLWYNSQPGYIRHLVIRGDLGNQVNGNWGSWTVSGSCGKTCGGGRQKSTRLCNNPSPQNGGKECVGESTKTSQCNMNACPALSCGNSFNGAFYRHGCTTLHGETFGNLVCKLNIDESDLLASSRKATCECAKQAKAGGYKTFAITEFWEECWGSKKTIEEFDSFGGSTKCMNHYFVDCSVKDTVCTGDGQSTYVFSL